jgi:hypothetical protein
MRIAICMFLNNGFAINCLCQYVNDESTIRLIEAKIEESIHHKYNARLFDIDRAVRKNNRFDPAKFADPYGTLKNCFVFLAEALPDSNLYKPKGFMGICRADSILWRSELLAKDFSNLSSDVSIINEINKDGKVEIVISQYSRPDGTSESIWIFNWDGKNGKLITELDSRGESKIKCLGDLWLNDVDGDGIYEILGKWYGGGKAKKIVDVVYSWNGSRYGQWGKSSKFLLEGLQK